MENGSCSLPFPSGREDSSLVKAATRPRGPYLEVWEAGARPCGCNCQRRTSEGAEAACRGPAPLGRAGAELPPRRLRSRKPEVVLAAYGDAEVDAVDHQVPRGIERDLQTADAVVPDVATCR